MQNQQSGAHFAQSNLDAAMRIGTQAADFWRRCTTLQAQGANQVLEESVRITRVILKTQSDMVDAASQFLSEGKRTMFHELERQGEQAADAVRTGANNTAQALQQSANQGSHGASQGAQGGTAGSQGGSRQESHRRAA